MKIFSIDPITVHGGRLAAGLTQAQAAKSVGVTTRTWRNWEYGATRIPDASWRLFCIKHPQNSADAAPVVDEFGISDDPVLCGDLQNPPDDRPYWEQLEPPANGAEVRAMREKAGLSMRAAANLLRIPYQTWYSWEANKAKISYPFSSCFRLLTRQVLPPDYPIQRPESSGELVWIHNRWRLLEHVNRGIYTHYVLYNGQMWADSYYPMGAHPLGWVPQ
jgi:DNA-binding transcriptional regulator YiaG